MMVSVRYVNLSCGIKPAPPGKFSELVDCWNNVKNLNTVRLDTSYCQHLPQVLLLTVGVC